MDSSHPDTSALQSSLDPRERCWLGDSAADVSDRQLWMVVEAKNQLGFFAVAAAVTRDEAQKTTQVEVLRAKVWLDLELRHSS